MKLTKGERVDELNGAGMAGDEETEGGKAKRERDRGRGQDGGCRVSHGTRQSGGNGDGETRFEKEYGERTKISRGQDGGWEWDFGEELGCCRVEQR